MRISDWSSDVCSSDLADDAQAAARGSGLADARLCGCLFDLPVRSEGRAAQIRPARPRPAGGAWSPQDDWRPGRHDRGYGAYDGEIGRAACRERGCQDESVWGGAGALKKKKKK